MYVSSICVIGAACCGKVMQLNAAVSSICYTATQTMASSLIPLAYTDVPEMAGLARSINTQPAVKRNSETNPTSQHNRGMY